MKRKEDEELVQSDPVCSQHASLLLLFRRVVHYVCGSVRLSIDLSVCKQKLVFELVGLL